jgi:outer membrane protein assembly factor BamE (lipoprotein component of BamABCDE complex)
MFKNIRKKNGKVLSFIKLFIMAGLVLTTAACVKNTDLVGYTFKSENLEQVKVGKANQNVVRMILGSPSVTSTYGDNIWYYISTEYETIAFLKPKIKHQKIVAISFDKNLKVSEIKEYSGKDAQDIGLISDITKAEGRDTGIAGELLGNVGRFNSDPARPKKISKPKNVP